VAAQKAKKSSLLNGRKTLCIPKAAETPCAKIKRPTFKSHPTKGEVLIEGENHFAESALTKIVSGVMMCGANELRVEFIYRKKLLILAWDSVPKCP
jgi:hypothetical protein